jgi:hypothetical protein
MARGCFALSGNLDEQLWINRFSWDLFACTFMFFDSWDRFASEALWFLG